MLFYIMWICEYIVENVIYFDKFVKVFDFLSILKILKYNRIIIFIFNIIDCKILIFLI